MCTVASSLSRNVNAARHGVRMRVAQRVWTTDAALPYTRNTPLYARARLL